ncbi:MAG: hypothetical protein NZ602_06070 [Thermoguttaceae bacterium]|nr:hypothetical protein [Thermoguttaceae bacterium]MDW8038611.1 hypothetical protein [Thermoguttaceae bacterium]
MSEKTLFPKPFHAHCCPCSCDGPEGQQEWGRMSRRNFLGTAALGSMALAGLSWSGLMAAEAEEIPQAPKRKPLRVKPILTYAVPQRRPQWSWRAWGGIETEEQAQEECRRIEAELEKIRTTADFPLEFMPLAALLHGGQFEKLTDLESADAAIVYAAGGSVEVLNLCRKLNKPVIIFCRHKSGPIYLWYEIISPRYLRQHTDVLSVTGIDEEDVVVDSLEEVTWRLRALCGLKNTVGSRIVAVGGPGSWATPKAPELAKERFKLDIVTVPYEPDLANLIKAAMADEAAVARAKRRADAYLAIPETKLETDRGFVDRAFLLEEIFRRLMQKFDCRAITINACMGTIMPVSQTTACLPLSTLNDDGWLAFCESDFVVVPAGILLGNISGLPQFLHNPTYPHEGIITIAHCTGPRKMDGKNPEPVRILTHFESDYGAAPKVERRKGQLLTHIIPDFKAEKWLGLRSEIVEAPFFPICRDQLNVRFKCDSLLLAQKMHGFHWMTCYGDYHREIGYALKRVGIKWEFLG